MKKDASNEVDDDIYKLNNNWKIYWKIEDILTIFMLFRETLRLGLKK